MNARSKRDYVLDLVRGAAVVGMVLFHIAIFHDATHQTSYTTTPSLKLIGSIARTIFVFLLGFSIALARKKQSGSECKRRYYLRLARRTLFIAAGATFVTVASAGNVRFGILHYMTVASLLVGLLPTSAIPLVAFATAMIITGKDRLPLTSVRVVNESLFGHVHYATYDIFPVVRWLPVTILGLMAGHAAKDRRARSTPPVAMKPLCWCGSHSLSIYILHFFILVAVYRWVPGRGKLPTVR